LVLHHATKAASYREGGNPANYVEPHMNNMRGASVLAGAGDLMLELRRPKESNEEATIYMTKQRDIPWEPPARLTLVTAEKPGGGLERARVFWIQGEEAKRLNAQEKEQRKANAEARSEGCRTAVLEKLRALLPDGESGAGLESMFRGTYTKA